MHRRWGLFCGFLISCVILECGPPSFAAWPGRGFRRTAETTASRESGSACKSSKTIWTSRLFLASKWSSTCRRGRDGGFEDDSRQWFENLDGDVQFGAMVPVDVPLSGSPELASSWLLEEDSLDRLVRAGQPAFSEIKRAEDLETEDGVQIYTFSLPSLDLLGIGRASSSVNLFGALRSKVLEIGTVGKPRVCLELLGGTEIPLPTVSLNVTGSLMMAEDPSSEKRSRVVGRISLDVRGEAPSIAGFVVPEEVLRAAASEACRQTCIYASKKLERELSEDFARWRGERVRAERALGASRKRDPC